MAKISKFLATLNFLFVLVLMQEYATVYGNDSIDQLIDLKVGGGGRGGGGGRRAPPHEVIKPPHEHEHEKDKSKEKKTTVMIDIIEKTTEEITKKKSLSIFINNLKKKPDWPEMK